MVVIPAIIVSGLDSRRATTGEAAYFTASDNRSLQLTVANVLCLRRAVADSSVNSYLQPAAQLSGQL